MGLNPIDLFDILERAIAEAETTPWWRRPKAAVWFNVPVIRIDTASGAHADWCSKHPDGPDRYGYTLTQAREMRRALLPVLGEFMAALEQTATALSQHDPHDHHR